MDFQGRYITPGPKWGSIRRFQWRYVSWNCGEGRFVSQNSADTSRISADPLGARLTSEKRGRLRPPEVRGAPDGPRISAVCVHSGME